MEEERERFIKELINKGVNDDLSANGSGSVVGKVGDLGTEEKEKKKKGRIKALVISSVVGLMIMIMGFLALLLFNGGGFGNEDSFVRENTRVAVFVAPMSAEVKINGEAYLNGIYDFSPGEYRVEITATGFKSRMYDFEVKPDRVTLLYDYLSKEGEMELANNEVDILRYLVNNDDDEMIREIEEYLFLHSDESFLSSINSPVRNIEAVRDYYGDIIDEYSYTLIKETLDAYFYFALSGTKNVRPIDGSFGEIVFAENEYLTETEFRVLVDKEEEYRVKLEVDRSQEDPDGVFMVYRVTVLSEAGTALFQYDGGFTSGDFRFIDDTYDDPNFDFF